MSSSSSTNQSYPSEDASSMSSIRCYLEKYRHKRLSKDFDQLSRICKGGFSQVFKGRKILENKEYAIKMLRISNENGKIDHAVENELQIMLRIEHKNVVRFFTAWKERVKNKAHINSTSTSSNLSDHSASTSSTSDSEISFRDNISNSNTKSPMQNSNVKDGEEIPKLPTILYIQMEYCERTLRYFIEQGLLLDNFDLICKFFDEILDGLNYIHSQNVIHRDIKPENIFITKNNEVKIGDFGLSKMWIKNTSELENCNDPQTYVGTGYYIAPEVRDNHGRSYNEKCDIYSLGVILFEMLCPSFTIHEKEIIFKTFLKKDNLSKDHLTFPNGFGYNLSSPIRNHIKKVIKLLLHLNPNKRPNDIKIKEENSKIHKAFNFALLSESVYGSQRELRNLKASTAVNQRNATLEEVYNIILDLVKISNTSN